jgi:hypothetical protein
MRTFCVDGGWHQVVTAEFLDYARFLAEDFLAATLATFARSLPVPLAAISTSLHRPLR